MIALKTLRSDLGAHLAAGLSAAHSKLGAQVNPPAVTVSSSTPYVAAVDYCNDAVLFAVTVVTKPGDLPAVADALDDLVDRVRSTLRTPSPAGLRYSFREVSGYTEIAVGDAGLPGVIATVAYERPVD